MSVNKETQHKDYQYNSKQISLLNLKLSELFSQFSNSALAFREIITPVQNLNVNISQLKGEINKLSYSNNDPMNVTDSTHRVAQNQQLDDYIRQIFSTNIKNVIRGLFVLVGATTSAMLFKGDRGIGGFAGLATFESIDLSLKTLYQIAATHPPSIGGGDPTMYNYYKGNKNYLLNDNEDNANSNNNFTRNTSASSNADDWGLSFVNKMLGNSVNRQIAWLQNQKNYSRNKKQKTHKYKKVQTKTTPDEDFGDEFINNIFNQFKTAFELKGLQFDKSKLLTEVIDFKNQYAAAFGEEIDLKKEIGILQDRLNLLQGDDVEILKQKIELQEKMNELSEADFKNKLKNKTEGVSTSILESLSEQMKYEHNWDYETPGRRYSVNSDFYKKTTLRGRNANIEESDNELKAKAKKNPDTKDTASKAKGAKDPLETFQNVFGEVQKVGGAMTTIMQTLHIGTDTFVGGVINGFNNALSIVQSILAVMQAMQTINSFLKFLPIPGLATGGTVPGTGNSDTVPAMLTPGEFVIKKSVVNKLGTQFFDHLNGGGFSSSIIGRYANGGVVASVPAQPQAVAVSIPDIKLKGSDLYLSWRRENKTYGRRSI